MGGGRRRRTPACGTWSRHLDTRSNDHSGGGPKEGEPSSPRHRRRWCVVSSPQERGAGGMAQRSHANLLPLQVRRSVHGDPGPRLPPAFPAGTTRPAPAGTVLLPEASPSGSIIVILEGLAWSAVGDQQGRRSVIGLLGPGDVIGMVSRHADGDRPTGSWPEVRTLSPCTFVVLSVEDLRRS